MVTGEMDTYSVFHCWGPLPNTRRSGRVRPFRRVHVRMNASPTFEKTPEGVDLNLAGVKAEKVSLVKVYTQAISKLV